MKLKFNESFKSANMYEAARKQAEKLPQKLWHVSCLD